jgi:hypothetical protein
MNATASRMISRRKQGVEHAEIVLPEGVQRRLGAGSVGLVERRRVCREAERCPRVAREFEIALAA